MTRGTGMSGSTGGDGEPYIRSRHASRERARGARELPVRPAAAGAARPFCSRCSSSSSRRCSRTTSASPSTAASTAYSASSTSVGSGNGRPSRSRGASDLVAKRVARQAAGVDDEPALGRCRARARRRRRPAPRSTRRSCRSGARRTCPRGRRSATSRCASRTPRPGASPCARTAPPSGAGSGSTRSGTSREAARTGCRPARGCRASARISGCPRWTTLRIGLYSDAGSLIGASAENRTVMRSAKSSSPGRGQKTRRNAPTVP